MRGPHGLDGDAAVERALDQLEWSSAEVDVATGFCERLLGFIVKRPLGLDGLPRVLVFLRCRSVHTCFMRFPLDIAFADERGDVISVCEGVPPWRVVGQRNAAFVLERCATPVLGCGAMDLQGRRASDAQARDASSAP